MKTKSDQARWFLTQIPQLQKEGIVDEKSALNLDRYYNSVLNQNVPKRRLAAILSIFGVIMILAGVILIINYNWDSFTKPVRLLIGAVPLAVAFVVSLITIIGSRNRLWKESSALSIGCGICCLYAVFSQVYQTNGSLQEFMILVLSLSLPFVYIFNSVALAALCIFALPTLFVSAAQYSIASAIIIVALMPFMIHHCRHASSDRAFCRYVAFFGAYCGVAVCGSYYPALALIVVTTALLYGGWHWKEKDSYMQNPWFFASFLVLLILLSAAGSSDCFFSIRMRNSDNIASFWIFTGAMLAANVIVFPHRRLDAKRLLTGLLVLLPFLMFIPGMKGEVMRVLFNVFTGVYGLVLLVDGFKRSKVLVFNGGLLMLGLLATCRFFDSEISVLMKSAVFIAVGAVFFITNMIFAKRDKR
jgi:hypothetical protein